MSLAPAIEAAPWTFARAADRLVLLVHRVWWWVAAAAVFGLVAVRVLRYAPIPVTPRVDHLLGTAMIVTAQLFLWPWAFTSLLLSANLVVVPAGILLLLLHRRIARRLFRRENGRWRFTPLMVSLTWWAVLWFNYLLDANPYVGLVCGLSLLVALAKGAAARGERSAPWAGRGEIATLLVLIIGIVCAPDSADRAAVAMWAFALLVGARLALYVLGRREVALCLVPALMLANVLAGAIPLVFPLHAAKRLGDGMAYFYCEATRQGLLFASVPVCTSVTNTYDECRDGRLVAYDRATLAPVAEYRAFSPDYFGRLEMIVCLDDEVLAAVQATRYQGKHYEQTAMSFPIATPGAFTPLLAGIGVGTALAYDAGHDAIFFGGEHTHRVVRYDRRTGKSREVGEPLRRTSRDGSRPMFSGSFNFTSRSIHPGRNRLYLAEGLMGRYVYAMDLSSLQIVGRYDVNGGGAVGVTVDVARDRLLVSSVWGLEVFDLGTDRLIARRRLGLGSRPAVLDDGRNRVYVSSPMEGSIRVLDRDTLALDRKLPIGMGVRHPYLSQDGRYLFAGSSWAHYAFDPATLVSGARGLHAGAMSSAEKPLRELHPEIPGIGVR